MGHPMKVLDYSAARELVDAYAEAYVVHRSAKRRLDGLKDEARTLTAGSRPAEIRGDHGKVIVVEDRSRMQRSEERVRAHFEAFLQAETRLADSTIDTIMAGLSDAMETGRVPVVYTVVTLRVG